MNRNKLLGIAFYVAILIAVSFIGVSSRVDAQNSTQQQQTDLVQRAHDLMPVAEKLRGLKFTSDLPVELIDQDQMKQIVSKELDEQLTPDQDRQYSALYNFLGLMPAGSSLKDAYQKMAEGAGSGIVRSNREEILCREHRYESDAGIHGRSGESRWTCSGNHGGPWSQSQRHDEPTRLLSMS